jgi:hypothetical protein
MSSRLSRRRFAFLGAEFVLIVAGVLVALALDQWRGRLSDRALEVAYAERLRNDLITDTVTFLQFSQVLDTKRDVLRELLRNSSDSEWEADPARHLARLSRSTFLGLPPITPATFDELRSTGRLNLLGDMELRAELASYYSFYDRLSTILDQLPGRYRTLVWSSMAGDVAYEVRQNPVASIDLVTFRDGLTRLRGHPELREAVNYELTYTSGLRQYLNEAHQRAADLLRTIESIYGAEREREAT